MKSNRKLVLALLAAVMAQVTFAHTTLESATPKSGAMLEQSPPVIEFKFKDAVQLTSVTVTVAGQEDRKLDFAPKASAQIFIIADPKLAKGRNEIKWRALSKDAHVMSGTVIYVVRG
jgi:copper resistance protein C